MNATTSVSPHGFSGVFPSAQYYGGHRGAVPLVVFLAFWFVVACVLAFPYLHSKVRNRRPGRRLLAIYRSRTDPIFEEHSSDDISWGLGKTLSASPDLRNGWRPDQLAFHYNKTAFCFSELSDPAGHFAGRDLKAEYEDYRDGEFRQLWNSDDIKLMLVQRPASAGVDPTLTLSVRRTSWSQCQFFWTKLLTDTNRKSFIGQVFERPPFSFPNSLCLHLVVVTSDGKVLVTETGVAKNNDYPGSWAISIGEQLENADLHGKHQQPSSSTTAPASRWVARALREELHLKAGIDFASDSSRFLAVTVEGDIANMAVVATQRLLIDSVDLQSRFESSAKPGDEFTQLSFFSAGELPGLLFNSSLKLHPSTPMRVLHPYRSLFGRRRLKTELLRLDAASR